MSQFGTVPRRFVRNRTETAMPRQKPLAAGVHAEYRREHYVFARAQSPVMQARDWESRTPPLRAWGSNALVDLALKVFG